MSLESIAQAIQSTDFFTAFRESELAYPIVLSAHLTCIAIFGGLILMTDLRLLGVALKSLSIADVVNGTRIWKRLGFAIMVSCGIMLGGAKIGTYYTNPYFIIKMSLLFLVFVHAVIFRPRVYNRPEALDASPQIPRVAKVAATMSLALWLGIMSMGRWIAYWESPDDQQLSRPGRAASRVP